MTEFRAKLRKPRSELWLGAEILSAEECVSKANGYPYVKMRFTNCPFVCIFGLFDGQRLHRILRERGMQLEAKFDPGTIVNLDVRWRPVPYDVQKQFTLPEYSPDVKIELFSFMETYGTEVYYPDRPGVRKRILREGRSLWRRIWTAIKGNW